MVHDLKDGSRSKRWFTITKMVRGIRDGSRYKRWLTVYDASQLSYSSSEKSSGSKLPLAGRFSSSHLQKRNDSRQCRKKSHSLITPGCKDPQYFIMHELTTFFQFVVPDLSQLRVTITTLHNTSPNFYVRKSRSLTTNTSSWHPSSPPLPPHNDYEINA